MHFVNGVHILSTLLYQTYYELSPQEIIQIFSFYESY